MDVALDEEETEKIQKILQENPKIKNFHEFRTRESGKTKFVEAHLVFGRDISLMEAHNIAHKLEDEIRAIDDENKWSILFHLDPYNDEIEDEKRK